MNLRVGYRWPRLKVTLAVLNLFDSNDRDIEYYYTSRLIEEPAEGVDDRYYHTNGAKNGPTECALSVLALASKLSGTYGVTLHWAIYLGNL